MSEPTPAELKALAERVRAYAESPEGQAEIEASLRRAEETCEEMRRSMRVDWRDLHRPMTI